MLAKLKLAVDRILGSKKAVYAAIPMLANLGVALTGHDVTQPLMLVLDAGFALLLLSQFFLDMRWGSPSDGTGTVVKILGCLSLMTALSACSVAIGPEGRWFRGAIWERANLELSVPLFGELCIGCLETEADPNQPEPE
jgi:hypothetical protein